MKQIILFLGRSETVSFFMYQLGAGFEKIGYKACYIDVTKEIAINELIPMLQNEIVACISFNNVGLQIQNNNLGELLYNRLKLPHINILIDNPIYFLNDLLLGKNDVVITIDKDHMNYVAENFPNIPINAFMPHGGTKLLDLEKQKRMNERSIDVLYAGSIHENLNELSVKNIVAFEKYSFDFESIKEKVYDRLLIDNNLSLTKIVDKVLKENDIELEYEEKMLLYYNLMNLERIVCSIFRKKLILEMLNSGIRLTLCGTNWDKYADIMKHPNLTYLGNVSSKKVLELMGDSKIVVNHMTWFKNGSHERIYNAMLASAVVASDESGYLCESLVCNDVGSNEWKEDAHIITYKLGEEDKMAEYLKKLLSNEKYMDMMALRGYKEAIAKHTWDCRAAEIDRDLLSKGD